MAASPAPSPSHGGADRNLSLGTLTAAFQSRPLTGARIETVIDASYEGDIMVALSRGRGSKLFPDVSLNLVAVVALSRGRGSKLLG